MYDLRSLRVATFFTETHRSTCTAVTCVSFLYGHVDASTLDLFLYNRKETARTQFIHSLRIQFNRYRGSNVTL